MSSNAPTVTVGLIVGLLIIVIGLVVLPVVVAFSDLALANANATTAPLIDLIPFFWVLAVVALAVGVIFLAFRSSGIL